MKNLPKLTWLLAAVAIFLAGNLIFTGCSKDKSTDEEKNYRILEISSPYGKSDITMEYGHLVFKDQMHFRATLKSIESFSTTELQSWLENFKSAGFVSILDNYWAAIQEQKKIGDSDERSTEAFRSKWADKVVFTTERILPLFPAYNIAVLLNEKSLIKIGENLVQYHNDRSIHIQNGKIDEFIKAIDLPIGYKGERISVLPFLSTLRPRDAVNNQAQERSDFDWCNTVTNGENCGSKSVYGHFGGFLDFFERRSGIQDPNSNSGALGDELVGFPSAEMFIASEEKFCGGIWPFRRNEWRAFDTNLSASGGNGNLTIFHGGFGISRSFSFGAMSSFDFQDGRSINLPAYTIYGSPGMLPDPTSFSVNGSCTFKALPTCNI